LGTLSTYQNTFLGSSQPFLRASVVSHNSNPLQQLIFVKPIVDNQGGALEKGPFWTAFKNVSWERAFLKLLCCDEETLIHRKG